MERVEEAIEAAYEAHITSLYKVLSQSILAANGNEAEIAAAQDRFKRGLVFAAEVRARARAAAGL
jgi:hypothetical protein